MCGTGVVFDPKVKQTTFNVWGAPGTTGNSIKGDPIKQGKKKKK